MANTLVANLDRRKEFEDTLSRSLPSFRQMAMRWVGNREDAEDAVQDAMLSAVRNLAQFDGRSQMSTWLTAIVINAARMHLRRRLRVRWLPLDLPAKDGQRALVESLADPAPDPEQSLEACEVQEIFNRLSERLSRTLLLTIQLRQIGGLSIREMANALGVPEGTVKARLARARADLKRRLSRVTGRFAANSSNRIRSRGREIPVSSALVHSSKEVAVEAHRFRRDFLLSSPRGPANRPGRNLPPHRVEASVG